jgi:hypothetical protein
MINLFIIYFHKINIFNVVIYSLDFVFNTLERAFRDEKTVERYERKKKKNYKDGSTRHYYFYRSL